ncbi:pre-mRNA-splicing factor cwf18 [Anaeramoeba ignava]|uniref:Pre-mRNA-splicing factor cwf18 n=1 Tax=Anaeramoeba ignava TaxID=1746090 RepID=A0A9Q0LGT8_ANAIG|nr:pre-mRNA-splicing factor cwf18 [Anaeramoeba ignava]
MNKNNFDNLHFRNYSPKDENLQKYKQPIPETVKNAEKMMEKMIQQSQKKSNQFNDVDGDLLELIPKKINWDLKRDVEKKLNKLEKRTQRAISEEKVNDDEQNND